MNHHARLCSEARPGSPVCALSPRGLRGFLEKGRVGRVLSCAGVSQEAGRLHSSKSVLHIDELGARTVHLTLEYARTTNSPLQSW